MDLSRIACEEDEGEVEQAEEEAVEEAEELFSSDRSEPGSLVEILSAMEWRPLLY